VKPVSAALAALLVRKSGFACTGATLRQWVRRGHIRKTGDGYDLASIAAYLERRRNVNQT
jgi:hypothetical protein